MTEKQLQAANKRLLERRARLKLSPGAELVETILSACDDAREHRSILAEDTTDRAEIDRMMNRFYKTFFSEIP